MLTLKQWIIIAVLLCLTACSPGTTEITTTPTLVQLTPTSSQPAATLLPSALTVNGESITLDEFNAELTRYRAAGGSQADDQQAAQQVAEEFISQLLLAQGAQEAGFTLDDSALQARIDALIAKLGGADKLSAWQQAHGYADESFRVALRRQAAAAWMRDKIAATVPSTAEQVHIRQILLYNQTTAQNYWDQLQAGSDFDTVAAQIDPVTHGDIGWSPRGYLPEKSIEDAVFALQPGEYSAVIEDKVGFHILKLIERQTDRPLSPDQTLTLQTRALSEWIASRRQSSTVVLTLK
jgi:parvulin-like peptidyl-prolyl isomerase